MNGSTFRLAIVANEASADVLGAALVRALRGRLGNRPLQVAGMGGAMLAAEGCELMYSTEEVRGWGAGLWSSVAKIRRILAVRSDLVRRLGKWQPDVFIGVDASDFNLKLARQLRQMGIRTVQYVSPSVWMWRAYRAARLAKSVDMLLSLYPFEKRHYANLPLRVEVVGHALADTHKPCTREAARGALGMDLPDGNRVLGLLFGSRTRELDIMGRHLAEVARLCQRQLPNLQCITAAHSVEFAGRIKALWQQHAPDVPLRVEVGRVPQVISASDAVLLCNGTVALEAMFLQRPMVSIYKISHGVAALLLLLFPRVFYGMGISGKRCICLPNIMANKPIVPEFIQYRLKSDKVAASVLGLLQADSTKADNPAKRQLAELAQLASSMPGNSADRAAVAVLDMLSASTASAGVNANA